MDRTVCRRTSAIASGSPLVRTSTRPGSPLGVWLSAVYTCASVSELSPRCLTSSTTPTTCSQVSPRSNDTREPMGLAPSHCLAIVRLITATRVLSRVSVAWNVRPWRTRTASVSK